MHDDADWIVKVSGVDTPVLVRTPATLAERPALLIQLALAKGVGLDETSHAIVPRAFLAAGHRVASFDLPNEGQRIDEHGQGLKGLAGAMAAGKDVVAMAVATGRAFIDRYLERAGGGAGPIVLTGISRGGFFAFHLFAADPRIAAVATFAPVTNLLAVREFADLGGSPLVRQANPMHLVPRIASRPTYCAITEVDERVSTADCRAFHQAIKAAAPGGTVHTLRIDPGQTHSVAHAAYHEGASWLLERVARAESVSRSAAHWESGGENQEVRALDLTFP